MPRGRGRSMAKRGRPRLRPATPPLSAENLASPSEPQLPKKRRRGRPSRSETEKRRQQEEAEAEAELELELEHLQQQVLDHDNAAEQQPSVSFAPNPKRRSGPGRPRTKNIPVVEDDDTEEEGVAAQLPIMDEEQSCGLHMTTMQIKALSNLVACKDCGESVTLSVRPTTKGMISEFVVSCSVCEDKKVTITPNLVRERKRKREVKGLVLQKTENINYAHVAAFLDNGLGYSGLRHYCKYFNARCLNEATFIVYARQVIQDVVNDTEDNLQSNARIVRKVYDTGLDEILDITVSFTTTYHQWGSDFCLVAGAVIELQTGLVLDYDVANMYCHVCKINAKRIISMTPTEMTDWFNKHQNSCEIREWCDELDHDAEEGVKDIEPKYLECFVAKKIWSRSVEKFGFRYSTLIHESDETIHNELLRSAPYGDTLVMIDNLTNCFSRRKSEHARTAFQNKLKSKCPRERVQTKDRIMYVYAMSIPEYNRFAVGSNIKLRELVRRMEIEEAESEGFTLQVLDALPTIQAHEVITGDSEIGQAVYTTHVQGGNGGDLYEVHGEREDEDVQFEEGDEDEEEDGEEETENVPAPNPNKRVKTEIKRENIVCEAVEDSAEYEARTAQTTLGKSRQPRTSTTTANGDTNDDSTPQIIVVSASGNVTPEPAATVSKSTASITQQKANGQSNITTVSSSKAITVVTAKTSTPAQATADVAESVSQGDGVKKTSAN